MSNATKLDKRSVTVSNKWGLHARPAFELVKTAKRFTANITIEKDGESADGRNVTDLLALCVAYGDRIVLTADGADGNAALDAIVSLIESKFGEDI